MLWQWLDVPVLKFCAWVYIPNLDWFIFLLKSGNVIMYFFGFLHGSLLGLAHRALFSAPDPVIQAYILIFRWSVNVVHLLGKSYIFGLAFANHYLGWFLLSIIHHILSRPGLHDFILVVPPIERLEFVTGIVVWVTKEIHTCHGGPSLCTGRECIHHLCDQLTCPDLPVSTLSIKQITVPAKHSLDCSEHGMCLQWGLGDIVCDICSDGLDSSARKKTGDITVAAQKVCECRAVAVQSGLPLLHEQCTTLRIHHSAWSDWSREPTLAYFEDLTCFHVNFASPWGC